MSFNMINSPTLVITYFYGTKGCCPAEWADDKIDSFEQIGERIILLTSIFSKKNASANVHHYSVTSLSIQDLRHEIDELKNEGMPIPYLKLAIMFPFIVTFGFGLDLFQKIITAGNGGSKWSWFFPASICSLYLAIRYNCKQIFATGGPASAHLAGCFTSILTSKRLICELQDPLVGKNAGRNSRSALLLSWVEKVILRVADKIVYVTSGAAEYASGRNVECASKIVSIYPGSRKFEIEKSINGSSGALTLIHLGTLYSTRNFYSLIDAIDELIHDGEIVAEDISILNLGEIYGEMKSHHLSRPYIRQIGIQPREEAIKIASSFKVLLLIQHSDGRSEATIPYKTYDYINIGNPILGLTNNDELARLLCSCGHICVDVNNMSEIKAAIRNIIHDYDEWKTRILPKGINIIEQTKKILE